MVTKKGAKKSKKAAKEPKTAKPGVTKTAAPTELKTLEVVFGGLCLLAFNRGGAAEEKGLFCLMPATRTMPMMVHCPMVAVEQEFIVGGTSDRAAPLTAPVDWYELNDAPRSARFPDTLLDMSKYATRRVDRRWLTSAVPLDCLAGRIRLPEGISDIAPLGDQGKLRVPDATGKYVAKPVVGRVVVTIPIKPNTPVPDLGIPGLELTPNSDGVLRVQFINVRLSDLDTVRSRHHVAGTKSPHVSAYYKLLDDNCPAGIGPDILYDETSGSDDDTMDEICLAGVKDIKIPKTAKGIFSINWIEPIQCTVGDGCGPDEQAC